MSTLPINTPNPATLASSTPTAQQLQDMHVRLLNAITAVRETATPAQNKTLDFLLNQAQSQAADLLSGDSSSSPIHHILANVKSLLMNATVLPTPTQGLVASTISDEGDLVGSSKYESLDFGWTQSAACWLEHIPPNKKASFSNNPPTIRIGNAVSIAIAGDWGTGVNYRTDKQPAPAQKVADQIVKRQPDYTVHLGDVYYAGTAVEETLNFLGDWPSGQRGSFTLNSNHEMLSGANGYFSTTLASGKFSAQQGCSYFALRNDNWLILGLDTAFYADEMGLYQHGHLDPQQCAFLQQSLDAAKGCRTILLTHHNGLSVDGATPLALWGQIAPLFADRELWWYWGHLHAGVVYSDRGKVHPRCCGHGAVPAGAPDVLVSNPAAIWYENQKVPDLLYQGRVHNGFVLLTLNNADQLKEAFINEDGLQVY